MLCHENVLMLCLNLVHRQIGTHFSTMFCTENINRDQTSRIPYMQITVKTPKYAKWQSSILFTSLDQDWLYWNFTVLSSGKYVESSTRYSIVYQCFIIIIIFSTGYILAVAFSCYILSSFKEVKQQERTIMVTTIDSLFGRL